ncbi:MAG: hypothetical protein FWE38_02845 [Firmicutes bacterium]|nr:hypothetical protein [Bacillota bacterium]
MDENNKRDDGVEMTEERTHLTAAEARDLLNEDAPWYTKARRAVRGYNQEELRELYGLQGVYGYDEHGSPLDRDGEAMMDDEGNYMPQTAPNKGLFKKLQEKLLVPGGFDEDYEEEFDPGEPKEKKPKVPLKERLMFWKKKQSEEPELSVEDLLVSTDLDNDKDKDKEPDAAGTALMIIEQPQKEKDKEPTPKPVKKPAPEKKPEPNKKPEPKPVAEPEAEAKPEPDKKPEPQPAPGPDGQVPPVPPTPPMPPWMNPQIMMQYQQMQMMQQFAMYQQMQMNMMMQQQMGMPMYNAGAGAFMMQQAMQMQMMQQMQMGMGMGPMFAPMMQQQMMMAPMMQQQQMMGQMMPPPMAPPMMMQQGMGMGMMQQQMMMPPPMMPVAAPNAMFMMQAMQMQMQQQMSMGMMQQWGMFQQYGPMGPQMPGPGQQQPQPEKQPEKQPEQKVEPEIKPEPKPEPKPEDVQDRKKGQLVAFPEPDKEQEPGDMRIGKHTVKAPSLEDILKDSIDRGGYDSYNNGAHNDGSVRLRESDPKGGKSLEMLQQKIYETWYDQVKQWATNPDVEPDQRQKFQEILDNPKMTPEEVTKRGAHDVFAKEKGEMNGFHPVSCQSGRDMETLEKGKGDFIHVFGNKLAGGKQEDIEARLYLNLKSENTVEFIQKFINKTMGGENKSTRAPYFKFYTNTDNRNDNFLIYTSHENAEAYIDVLEQIKKEHPELVAGTDQMSRNFGNVNSWIGYGDEPSEEMYKNHGRSYNSSRESLVDGFMWDKRKDLPSGEKLEYTPELLAEFEAYLEKNGVDKSFASNVGTRERMEQIYNKEKTKPDPTNAGPDMSNAA